MSCGCQQHCVHCVMCNSYSLQHGRSGGWRSKPWYIVSLTKKLLDIDWVMYIIRLTMPRRRPAAEDSKAAALRVAGALHPHPEHITDELFGRPPFFDRRDRVQVKYEMLRAHDVDGRRISEVARAFGTSRQAFYAAAATFQAQGIPGLLPRPRVDSGPN
jgi:hypothetical protein